MRRVIGNDDVDRTVLKRLKHGVDILLPTQRRIDLGGRIQRIDTGIRQNEVMRRNFRRDLDAAPLPFAHKLGRTCRTDVRNMDGRIDIFCK